MLPHKPVLTERPKKYERIAADLERITRRADAGRPAHLPSERDLTRRYGVDRSTVRRALHLLEEQGLIVRQPGRRTQIIAHQKARRRAGVRQRVAFVVNAAPRGWATLPAFHGAEAVLDTHGCELLLYSTFAEDPFQAERRERDRLDMCLRSEVAGVLLWPASRHGNAPLLQQLGAAGIPVVLIDQQLPEPPLDFAGIDNVAAAYRITEHLIRAGHRRIAHFTRANTMPTTLQRIEGYCRALEDHGIPFEDAWLRRCHPGRGEEESLDALLAAPAPPTALFAINDTTALRLLQHLRRRAIPVPEGVAVAGIDDLPVTELSPVPLTTMAQPFEAIGAEAARLLVARLQGRAAAAPVVRLLPTELIHRASCGARSAAPASFAPPPAGAFAAG